MSHRVCYYCNEHSRVFVSLNDPEKGNVRVCEVCQCTRTGKNPIDWMIDEALNSKAPTSTYIRINKQGSFVQSHSTDSHVTLSLSVLVTNKLFQFSIHGWTNDGSILQKEVIITANSINCHEQSLSDKPIKEKLKVAIEDYIKYLHKIQDEGSVTCSGCNIKTMQLDQIAGSHFAGSYCSECWENYKTMKSNVCTRCNLPMYKCNC